MQKDSTWQVYVGRKGMDEDGEIIAEIIQLVQSTCRKRQEERQSEKRNITGVKKGLGKIEAEQL